MSRRTERLGSLIREMIGTLVLSKLSDPRIDPVRTSITRVEVTEDLLTARVFVSVMGTPAEQRRAVQGLRHAAGHLQERMMEQVRLRHTPVLQFEIDTQYKKTLETLALIDQAMDEIRRKESRRAGEAEPRADEGEPGAPAGGPPPSEQDQE